MDYKNENCIVCGKQFEDDDDIVVCPECGTPHHRACWMIDNRCACEGLHGTGYEWKKREPDVNIPETEPFAAEQSGTTETDTNESGTPSSPFGFPAAPVQDINNVDTMENLCMRGVPASKDEMIDGVRVGDIALYIQQNARHYIKKFKKGKITINWAALIFAPAWFFYRKLYKAGAIVLALFVAISLFTTPIQNSYMKLTDEIAGMMKSETGSEEANYSDIEALMTKPEFMSKAAEMTKKGSILLAVNILPKIAVAFCANEIYKRKIKRDIESVNEATNEKSIKSLLIMQEGGVALFVGAIVFVAADYVVPMLMSAGNFFTDLF